MKRTIYSIFLTLICAVAASLPAWAQTAKISGTVTDNDKPLSGVQVIYKNINNGRQIKMKTDSKGSFFAIGVPSGTYDVSVVDAGKTIFSQSHVNVSLGGEESDNLLNIDITKGATAKSAGGGSMMGGAGAQTSEFHGPAPKAAAATGTKTEAPTITKEEREKLEAQKVKSEGINALISKYQAAVGAKDWAAALPALQGMVAADPTRWEYFKALGEVQFNSADYEGSVQSYEKGIQVAQGYVSGSLPRNSSNPNSDPAKSKVGMGQMYAEEGSSYLRLKNNAEAIKAFTKAAELDPSTSGAVYYNLCATQYNTGNMEGAAEICDKAIQADPNRADAYFIKGAALYGSGKMDANNKYVVPQGTSDALQKYLELAPDGPHAGDVKAMLQALGSPIETNYKSRKKK